MLACDVQMMVGANSGATVDSGVEDTNNEHPILQVCSICMAALHVADWPYTRPSPWPTSQLLPWFRVISLVCLRFP